MFFAPPTSTLGSFDELNLEYELSSGGAGAVGELRGPLERPVIASALIGPAECHATEPAAVCGLVITSASVAAVSVNGGPAIPTVPAVTAPFGFRSILYEVQGVAISELRGTIVRKVETPAPLRTVLTALSSSGTPITSTPPLNLVTPFVPVLETREWVAPAPPAQGVCQMAARPIRGLTAASGGVVSDLRPVVGLIARPFITCVATRYTYRYSSTDESSLQAYMVVDAVHPGVAPEPLPGMTPVAGHPGVEQSRLEGLALVARRVPGAWLLVESGRELGQRLALLADLRGSVHLRPSGSHRRSKR